MAGRRAVDIGAGVVGAVAAVGTEVEIRSFDRRTPDIVTAEPLFDPRMTRLRG